MDAMEGVVVAVFNYRQAHELLMRCLNHPEADSPEFASALETLADAIKESMREFEDTRAVNELRAA
jgi:hypothetical protein